MKPEEPTNQQSDRPLLPQRSVLVNPQPEAQSNQEAAANVIRSQINTLLSDENSSKHQEYVSPYQQTHTEHTEPQADKWKEYHSAWQNYYQKYYEGYYTHHLKAAQLKFREQATNSNPTDESAAEKEAIFDLRQKLIGRVKESATKVKKSRHFIPLIAGIAVVLVFLFLQYNRIIFANVIAYVSPGSIDPQNIVISPNSNVVVGPEPRLIIPKINVDVPVIYDIGSDYDSQMEAMTRGVAHFAVPGASSHPGQIGNTVIAGHSANDVLDSGDYKFIFAQLDKMQIGDTIYANYNSVRYTYVVTKKEVVKPSDVSKLIYPTTLPIMTLLTCTPLGTALNRLFVIAEQVSPDPAASSAAPTEISNKTDSIPGNSLTLFERIFGKSN